MASRKSIAMKEEAARLEQATRWERLELLVLALAEKAGIDVEEVLRSVSAQADEPAEVQEEEQPAEEPAPKKRSSKKAKADS